MIRDEVKNLLKDGFEGKIDHPAIEKFGDFSVRGDVDLNSNNELVEKIEKIAKSKAMKLGVKFWKPKKIDENIKTSGFYKQFFCGCVYSLEERYEEKYKVE